MNPTVAMNFHALSSKLREVYLSTRAEIEGKDAELAEATVWKERAQARMLQLEARNAELEARIADLPRQSEARLMQELDKVGKVLDKARAHKDKDVRRIAELKSANAELESANAELEAGVVSERQMHLAHISQLDVQVALLEAEKAALHDDNVELVASVELLESAVTVLERKNGRLDDELDHSNSERARVAERLAETENYLEEADAMNAEKDGEIEGLHGEIEGLHAAAAEQPASKKRRRGDSLRREFVYDHVAVVDGRVHFRVANAEFPATATKLRYIDVITGAGRSYNRYYVIRDGEQTLCRSMADVERAFGLRPRHGNARRA